MEGGEFRMKLESVAVVDHRNTTVQPIAVAGNAGFGVVVPGASTCCVGCTSSSCGAVVRPE
jgi:hypothetical protein